MEVNSAETKSHASDSQWIKKGTIIENKKVISVGCY